MNRSASLAFVFHATPTRLAESNQVTRIICHHTTLANGSQVRPADLTCRDVEAEIYARLGWPR